MKKKLSIVVISLALATFSAATNASNFNYKYVEANLENIDGDEGEEDSTLYGVKATYPITKELNVNAGFNFGTAKVPGGTIDTTGIELGVQYHLPLVDISNETDGVAGISYIGFIAKGNGISKNESGFKISTGLRHKFTDTFESTAMLNHTRIADESDTGFNLGARYYVKENMSIGIDTTELVDWNFSARFGF